MQQMQRNILLTIGLIRLFISMILWIHLAYEYVFNLEVLKYLITCTWAMVLSVLLIPSKRFF